MRPQTEEIEIDFSAPLETFSVTKSGRARIEELLDALPDTYSKPRRIYLLQEAARIYVEELEDPEAAMVVLQAALQEDVHYAPVIDALADAADRTDGWSALIADLVSEAHALANVDARAASQLWTRIACWYYDPHGDTKSAQEAIDEAHALASETARSLDLQAQLFLDDGAWVDALDAWDRLRCHDIEERRRVELLVASGDIARQNLGDDDRALNYYRMAQEIDSTCIRALNELEAMYRASSSTASLCRVLWKKAKLESHPDDRIWIELEVASLLDADEDTASHAARIYERLEDPQHAAQLMADRAKRSEPEERARLHYRIARMYMHLGQSSDLIEWHLQEALSHDSDATNASTMLIDLYRDSEQWGKAASMHEARARRSRTRRTQVRALMNAARIHRDHLRHPAQAAELCRQARAIAPGLGPAAKMLADIHFEQQEWSELAPLVQELLTSEQSFEPSQQARVHLMAGQCAQESRDHGVAMDHFEQALRLVPDEPETLLALGRLCFEMNSWQRVVEVFGRRLRSTAAFRSASEKADVLYLLGEAQRRLGHTDAALARFGAVLELVPRHRDALAAQTEIHAERGDWKVVASAKRNRLQTATDEAKAMLLADLGDIESDALQSPDRALAAYQQALVLKPDDHRILQRILDLAARMERWPLAYETILRFATLENDNLRKGHYYLAAAEICRDRLGARGKAAEYYGASLDAFFAEPDRVESDSLPRYMKAFADLDEILTRERAWKQQEVAYRQMIKRLPPGHALIPSLWTSLAEIYRSRLRKPASAIAALEVVRTLVPKDIARREQLAELYVLAGPDSVDKAIAEHQAIIDIDSKCHGSYEALAKLYGQTGQQDAHWSLCQALIVLERATPEQRQFVEAHRASFTRLPRNPVPASLWPKLVHADQDPAISSLFLLLAPSLLSSADRSAKAQGLRSRENVVASPELDERLRHIFFFSGVLGMTPPEVYVKAKSPGRLGAHLIASKGAVQPALSVGAHFFSVASKSERAFAIGQALCNLRQEHWLALFHDSAESLQAIIDWSIGNDAQSISRDFLAAMEELRTGSPVVFEQLHSIAKRLREKSVPLDAALWLEGHRATADRVGLLMCGDLSAAARSIASEGVSDTVSRMTGLFRFSTSEDYFALRRALS